MSNPLLNALWIDVLNQVCSRAAHELKGALNGVSVNVEVVRSRAERADTAASAVSSFATAAASQLETVMSLSDALLELARPARVPFDVGLAVGHFETLLAPAARSDGRRLYVDANVAEFGHTSADGFAARMTIGACLLAAIDASPEVRCSMAGGHSLHIVGCPESIIGATEELVAAADAAGIGVEQESDARSKISITFPR